MGQKKKKEDSTICYLQETHFKNKSLWRRKWQPTPVFLPGESQGRWSLVGCRLWGHERKKKKKKSLCNFFCNLLLQISHHTSKRK